MKVYGVWSGYEEMDGVFSIKEKAEEYVNKCITNWTHPFLTRTRECYSIIEYTVDDPEADD